MAFKIPQVQTGDRLTNQMQQNIAGAIEPLFNDLTGTFQIAVTGCTTVPAGFAIWQRDTAKGPVVMQFPLLTGTSNAASCFLTGLPAALWPKSQQAVLVRVYDNGTIALAIALINTDGTIQLYKDVSSATFTISGAKGIALSCVTYITSN